MNADGSAVRQIITMKDYNAQGSPDWSPDGKLIAFDAWRASAGERASAAHVFVAHADGGEPRDLGAGAMPSFSPDGKQIAFTSYRPQRGVFVMNADGGDRRLIDADGWSGHWSPDGKSLMYGVGGNLAVYDVKTKTSRTVLVGEHGSRYRYVYWNPCWSPDGRRIAFKAQLTDETYELAWTNTDGSDKGFKVLYSGVTDADLAWHPDGKRLVFSMRDPMRKRPLLFELQVDEDKPPRVLLGQPLNRANVNCDWSPDGKMLAFCSRELPKK
jgi:Tol biopolymer transport system component